MAPKSKGGPVDKAKVAAKAKQVEDKTFGLKNKNKSTKVQKFVQNMKTSVMANVPKPVDKKDKKKEQEEAAKELNALFKVAIKQPKAPEGVDPKSIVCEFFRHGQCTKGAQCKYSHDLAVERKGPKIDLFTDQREVGKGDEEGMADWDQAALEAAIKQKHANENKPTEIVCKYFLDAVEKRLYGWFWKCPVGDDCKYRHALPPGYVLKSQMKELLEEEARNQKDIAEAIEEERSKVEARTPVTEATFKLWHHRKREAKAQARADVEEERRRKGLLNGREIFMQEGFVGIDDASAEDDYAREDDEEAMIREMMSSAAAAAERARQQESVQGQQQGEGSAGAGPSTSSGAGPSTSSGAQGAATHLTAQEAGALFEDDDDDDDGDGPEDDEDEDLEDDDDGDEDLEGLEAQVKGMHMKGAGAGDG